MAKIRKPVKPVVKKKETKPPVKPGVKQPIKVHEKPVKSETPVKPVVKKKETKPPVKPGVKPFTDEEFFQKEREMGLTQDTPAYFHLHSDLGRKIWRDFNALDILDIGCGPGAMVEALLTMRRNAWGFDKSEIHHNYFAQRNPAFFNRFLQGDISQIWEKVDQAQKECGAPVFFDVISSIEMAEHCTDDELKPFFDQVAKRCRRVVFSSTPYPHESPEFDAQWGHINVKDTAEWIAMFNDAGMLLVDRWTFPTQWTLVFEPAPAE